MDKSFQDLIDALATNESVIAIGLAGSLDQQPNSDLGDLDLCLYCSKIPDFEERRSPLDLLHGQVTQIRLGRSQGGHWGDADSCDFLGIETWLMYFSQEEACSEIKAILKGEFLDRIDGDYYPTGRLAMLNKMTILYDPQGILRNFKNIVSHYPESLSKLLLEYHLALLEDTEDLDRATLRLDPLFYHFALDLALDHFLQVLFACNRVYFPSRKRSIEYIDRFQVKPDHCSERLLEIVQLGARPETLASSYQAFQTLVGDLQLLIHGIIEN